MRLVNTRKFICYISFYPHNNLMRKTVPMWLFPPFPDERIEDLREMTCLVKCTWLVWLKKGPKPRQSGYNSWLLYDILSNKRLTNILCLHFLLLSFLLQSFMFKYIYCGQEWQCLWEEVMQSPSSEYPEPENCSPWIDHKVPSVLFNK